MQFPIDFENKIICGNCLEVMKDIPDSSIDLIVTSPPYNLKINRIKKEISKNWKGKSNNSKLQSASYDIHNDYMPDDEYLIWQKNVLAECLRVIKDTGAIFYNQKWRVQKGEYKMRLDIIEGLPLRQIIIWAKPGGINFSETFFLPTFEPIYIIAKPKFRLPPKINAYGDVWSITTERKSWHPAAFPIELAARCIQATTGDLILDPFSGSGTTAVAAKQLGKKYIGIDISEDYCKKAEER